MKTSTPNQRRVPARFGREVRFELVPRFKSLRSGLVIHQFEHLKARLLKPVLNEAPSPALRRQLRLAANEAAAVAWTTPFPLLLLPILLQEKADEVRRYAERQKLIQEASPFLAETTV
jgi:hypothetical protein